MIGRSSVVARANIAVATANQRNGYRPAGSMWMYYPNWGMFTYLPRNGRIYSPFGWYFYSPAMIWAYYQPIYAQPSAGYNNGGGQQTSTYSGLGNAGYSGAGSSGGAAVSTAPAAAAPSAPVASPGAGRGR